MPEGWIFDTLSQGNFIPGMTTVIRRCCFEVTGGIDESLVTEDWDTWLRISRQFKFGYFPEPTAFYRIVPTSMIRMRSEEIVESEQRMFIKCLRRGWLTGQKKDEAIGLEYLHACRAYCQSTPNRIREAAWTIQHRLTLKHAILLIFVLAHLPYRQFEATITRLSTMKGLAKSLFANRGAE